jgi:hypothetical protein
MRDSYFEDKFVKDERGEFHVRPHWSFDFWIMQRTAKWHRTPSPDSAHFARAAA